MTVEVEIIDRVYNNMCDFCEINGIDVNEYMSNAIMERYNLDRYGDLNEKLSKKEEKKPTVRKTKKEEPIKEISDKEDGKKQDIGAQVAENKQGEETKSEKETGEPTAVSDVAQTDVTTVKKVKRTLKTK